MNYYQEDMKWCVELQIAAMTNNWDRAKTFDRRKLESAITNKAETALHIAAAARNVEFAESLVNHISEKDPLTVKNYLEMKNVRNNTALCYAASTGIRRLAEVMVRAHGARYVKYTAHGTKICYVLPSLGEFKPLLMAACAGHCEMVKYLFDITNFGDWKGEDRFELFTGIIGIDMCEEALQMLKDHKELGIARDDDGNTALRVLARRPTAFACKSQPCRWRKIVGVCTNSRKDTSKQTHAVALVEELYGISLQNGLVEHPENPNSEIAQALMIAAEKGNEEFLIALIRLDPNLTWKVHEQRGSIFHIAIRNRYRRIFNLCDELGSIKEMVAQDTVDGDENMLHLAAKLAPQAQLNLVSGAALQMQLELVWYKEVEKIVQPSYINMENAKGKTPQMVFTEEHKELMHNGEKWMKETAKSSMVVAALIATVMFTAAFTVPGGLNSSGRPVFQKQRCFLVFYAADALGLLCSSTSILMFHSIITSRYAEIDFLESLPFRLMVGITSLFVSVAAMMVAFSATFPLYYPHDDLPWTLALFGVFACVPTLYVSLKYHLVADLIRSTYGSHFMFRQSRKQLFFSC